MIALSEFYICRLEYCAHMKKFLALLLITGLFACKEKDLTIENPALPDENIKLSFSFIYGDKGFNTDTLITNDIGLQFYIDEVKMLVSNLYFNNAGDTLTFQDTYGIFGYEQTEKLFVEFPAGNYTGQYSLTVGVDSLTSITGTPASGSPLLDPDVKRLDGLGYDHFILKGRLLDPADPNDTIGKIPFEYRIGTWETNITELSTQQNFYLNNSSNALFVIQVDITDMLDDLDILQNPMVASDPTNFADFQMAKNMAADLEINLF